jgi:hypothetical protein
VAFVLSCGVVGKIQFKICVHKYEIKMCSNCAYPFAYYSSVVQIAHILANGEESGGVVEVGATLVERSSIGVEGSAPPEEAD